MAGAVPSHLVTRIMRFDFVTGSSMARGRSTRRVRFLWLRWFGAVRVVLRKNFLHQRDQTVGVLFFRRFAA